VGSGVLFYVFAQKEHIRFTASKEFGTPFLQIRLALSPQDTGGNE